MPKNNVNKKRVKKRLPLIICECGTEILLMPDLKGMSDAIETHVEEHVKETEDLSEAETTAERIREDLIAQIFKRASMPNRSSSFSFD